ncbi:MAG TPA: type II secretion system minor pseudopilin GspI [Candidatus Acidoferrum sp.]|nr:type II secretion system minor pseudopilin GspI [Candidatus Acidoferrum sp.]
MTTAKGFTLLEIMIALTIFAVMSACFLTIASNHVGNAGYLEDKTLAMMIAANEANRLRVQGLPDSYATRQYETMAAREWEIHLDTDSGGPFGTRKATIKVGLKADAARGNYLADLTTFLP